MQQHTQGSDRPLALKVLVPDMPMPLGLMPYLVRMASTRVYANNGPLSRQLATRISGQHRNLQSAVVSTGTAALELALKAAEGRAHYNELLQPLAPPGSSPSAQHSRARPTTREPVIRASSSKWSLLPSGCTT